MVSTAAPATLAQSGYILDKLGRRARVGNGSTPNKERHDYWTEGAIPWLNSSVVNRSHVAEPSARVTEVALKECHLPVVMAGSLLVGLTGQGRTRGMTSVTTIDTTISQHLAYVEPANDSWSSEFLLWQLRASYQTLRALSDENGSTKGGLTCGDLAELRVAMPPVDEQIAISQHIRVNIQHVDRVIGKARELIEMAKERRSALISAAVTGQLNIDTYVG